MVIIPAITGENTHMHPPNTRYIMLNKSKVINPPASARQIIIIPMVRQVVSEKNIIDTPTKLTTVLIIPIITDTFL